MTTLFNILPDDIVRHIYEYDNTYREIFTKTVLGGIYKKSWKKWIKKAVNFQHYDKISSDIDFTLDHFVENNKQYGNDHHFPDEIMIRATDFGAFTNENERFIEIEGHSNLQICVMYIKIYY
jgi:hypothetical protein